MAKLVCFEQPEALAIKPHKGWQESPKASAMDSVTCATCKQLITRVFEHTYRYERTDQVK